MNKVLIANLDGEGSYSQAGQLSKMEWNYAEPSKTGYRFIKRFFKCRDFLNEVIASYNLGIRTRVIFGFTVEKIVDKDLLWFIRMPKSEESILTKFEDKYWDFFIKLEEACGIPIEERSELLQVVYKNKDIGHYRAFRLNPIWTVAPLSIAIFSLFVRCAITLEEFRPKFNEKFKKDFDAEGFNDLLQICCDIEEKVMWRGESVVTCTKANSTKLKVDWDRDLPVLLKMIQNSENPLTGINDSIIGQALDANNCESIDYSKFFYEIEGVKHGFHAPSVNYWHNYSGIQAFLNTCNYFKSKLNSLGSLQRYPAWHIEYAIAFVNYLTSINTSKEVK